jgi:hypothetical protein
MKSKFLIIAFLIFSLMAAFALKANAQFAKANSFTVTKEPTKETYLAHSKVATYSSFDEVLLADETTITETKTGAKIECSNDKVHYKLYEKWQHTFKRYSWTWKKDRHGTYKFYTITVSQKDGNLIKEWAKTYL